MGVIAPMGHGTHTNAPSVTLVASRPQFAHGDDHSWPEAHAQWFKLHMEGVTNNWNVKLLV